MTADPSQVIVTTGFAFQAVQVHHRYIPELNADGDTPESAAVKLVQDLEREIDCVEDKYHVEAFQHALADVRAFIERSC
jgi:hypothetical protein